MVEGERVDGPQHCVVGALLTTLVCPVYWIYHSPTAK